MRLVFSVVQPRNANRSAEGDAEIVLQERALRASVQIVTPAVGVQHLVLVEPEEAAMIIVRAGLHGKVRERRLRVAVLRGEGPGLQFELAHGVDRRSEFIIAAAIEIEAADRDPVDQDLMRIGLAAVDRPGEGIALRTRHAAEDESLQLPRPVVHENRPCVDFFVGGVDADLGGRSLEQRCFRRHGDLLRNLAHLEREIDRHGLADQYVHVVRDRSLETGKRGGNLVLTRWNVGGAIDPRLRARGLSDDAGRLLNDRDIGARHDGSAGILDDPRDGASRALPCGGIRGA